MFLDRGGEGAPDRGFYVVSVFADRTLEAPLEEILEEFETYMEQRGVEVEFSLVYGSSGYALSQLQLRGYGDIYLADGMVYPLRGVEMGLLDESSLVKIGWAGLALVVAEGNPKGIRGLYDALERDDIRLAIGNPEHVTAGVLAWRIFEEEGLTGLVEELIREGRVIVADSAFQAAVYVRLGIADAAITFRVYVELSPEELDAVEDPLVSSVGDYVVLALPRNKGPLADELYDFIISRREIFYEYGVEPLNGGAS